MNLNLFLPQRKDADTCGAGQRSRRALGLLGHTWVFSPVRRLSQALCFGLFLVLFFYVAWPYGAQHYAEAMQAKEILDAESFLTIDPLVSVSAALAARTWVWSLAWAAVALALCLIIPRWFCGYACPLGTMTDLFHWLIGRRLPHADAEVRWWHGLRYYGLSAVLAAAAFGVLLSGFVSAMPLLVRGMTSIFGPVQMGFLKGWDLVPPLNVAHYVSALLLLGVLALGLLGQRFWCRHLCPSGALLSAAGAPRLTRRKVRPDCIECGRCVEVCPFGAINADYSTRAADCTFCQTCGGACPVQAITFTARWDRGEAKAVEPAAVGVSHARRGFLAGVLVGPAAAIASRYLPGFAPGAGTHPIRPPGSVPEREFLRLCVSCAECFKACPNNVLQPVGFGQGLDGLGTPEAVPDWSGCEPTCNNCGQVCPTGAIRALPLQEKRAARMGLAVVNEATCLPHAGREACQMCYDECLAAGYEAIEFVRVGVEVDESGMPREGSGFVAPVVLAHKCVGCGLCQTRCYGINVRQKGLLKRTAIEVFAGPDKEDRMMTGSYVALREAEGATRRREQTRRLEEQGIQDTYLPDFLR